MAKRLVMTFKTAEGTTSTMTVEEPKNDLTSTDVRDFMNNIITKNFFNTKTGNLIEVKSAEVITTTEEVLI